MVIGTVAVVCNYYFVGPHLLPLQTARGIGFTDIKYLKTTGIIKVNKINIVANPSIQFECVFQSHEKPCTMLRPKVIGITKV